MSTDERIALFEHWKEKNPLRVYRAEHGFSALDAATMIGCSYSALLEWEKGATRPRAEKLVDISVFMGMPVTEVIAAWERWFKQRPR